MKCSIPYTLVYPAVKKSKHMHHTRVLSSDATWESAFLWSIAATPFRMSFKAGLNEAPLKRITIFITLQEATL